MASKQNLIASERPFFLARDISKWMAINSKKGNLKTSLFARYIDKFILLNEELLNNAMSASKCKKHHTFVCPECFVNLLYGEINKNAGEGLSKDFQKRFIL